MRRLWMLYLTLGLVASQGCHKTMQHTAGICDCYPPPVESLLIAPCPSGHHGAGPVGSSYAPAPHVTLPNGGPKPPVTPPKIIENAPPKIIEKSTDVPTNTEPIRALPKIAEPN